jgi:hypothetical protein
MAFWVSIDDSSMFAELLAGAGAAALAASMAALAQYEARVHFRARAEWVAPAWRLPLVLVRETAVVMAALWARIVRGRTPPSEFIVVPAKYGRRTSEGATRRTLIIGATSFAPNRFVLGMDAGEDLMVVHQLVPTRHGGPS